MIKAQVGILHLDAKLPPPQPRPEVLVLAAATNKLSGFVVLLLHVKPPQHGATAVLHGHERAPAIRPRQLALSTLALRERWHDECRVKAQVIGPAGGHRELGCVPDGLECSLKERLHAGNGLAIVTGGVMGIDLDCGGPVLPMMPVKLGEMFWRVPVWRFDVSFHVP